MNWLTGSDTKEAKRLIGQLSDPAKAQRAASELMRLGAGSAPALIEALGSREPGLAGIASQILVRIGSGALPALIETLGQAHPLVRAQAAEVLGKIGDTTAIAPLLDALHGEFYTVRAASAHALGEIGHSQCIPELIKALKDADPPVRIAAARALGKFHVPAVFEEIGNVLLDDGEIEVRQAAARALGSTHHPAAMPYLVEALGDSFWWYERESAAAPLLESIQEMGSLAVEPLIEAINNSEGTVRRYAASLLGNLQDRRATQALGMALYDMHNEVGAAAALALSRLGEEGLDYLDEAARHPEAGIRQNVAGALAHVNHPRAVTILIDLARDPERAVLKQAIQSLGAMQDPRATEALAQRAADRSDRELQAMAKENLAKRTVG